MTLEKNISVPWGAFKINSTDPKARASLCLDER